MSLINQDELMKRLGITSRNTLYIWRKQGCPCIQKGRFIRYEFDQVVEWLRSKNND